MKDQLIICSCGTPEHLLVFRSLKDEDWTAVALDVHLSNGTFWNRLKYSLKYLFGYKSKYGAFDEIILTPDHIPMLKEVIKELEEQEPVQS